MEVTLWQPPPLRRWSNWKINTFITSRYIAISYEMDEYMDVYFLSDENWKNNKTHKLFTSRGYDRISLTESEHWWREDILWWTWIICKWKWFYVKRDFGI